MSWPLKTFLRSILLLVSVHTASVFPGSLMAGQTLTRQPERDRQLEDGVAKVFDEVRKESSPRPLSRIGDRKSLEQLVCTAAVTGKVPKDRRGHPLGIELDREGEVYECGPDASLWQYGGWFYLSGELIQPGERMTDAGSGFQFYFVDAKRLPKPEADFGESVLAVEFSGAKVPWVIAERP
jgi:hypothetical protein